MNDLLDINVVEEKLKTISDNYLFLARFITARPLKSGIQATFKVICKVPLCLDEFDDQRIFSKFENYYCIGRSIYEKMDEYGKAQYLDAHRDEDKIKVIDDYLSDRFVVIRPRFIANRDNYLFKNGDVVAILDHIKPYQNKQYLIVPYLKDEATINDKFLKNATFTLSNYAHSISGNPEYLLLKNGEGFRLTQPKLSVTDNDYFWKKSEDSFLQFDFEKKLAIQNDDMFLLENHNIAFISTDFLAKYHVDFQYNVVSSPQEENKEEEPIVIDTNEEIRELERFVAYAKQKFLYYSDIDIFNFHTCLKCGQLTILAGMSGTGKTKLPYLYKQYFNLSDKEFLFVPISPTYSEPNDILGYLNPNSEKYVASETGIVELLKHAQEHKDRIHIILFDEMNLSQIEYWFAPFISILEKDIGDRKLNLYSPLQDCKNKNNYPPFIDIGTNVLFVGTINLDETTKNLSDRVLDRSFIINLQKNNFTDYSRQIQNGDEETTALNPLHIYHQGFGDNFNYIREFKENELVFFDHVHKLLNDTDGQKGVSFRILKNIATYLTRSNQMDDNFERKDRFDLAFKQTIVKKITGSELETLLDDTPDAPFSLFTLLDNNKEICEFKETRKELKNKAKELKKYGYTR